MLLLAASLFTCITLQDVYIFDFITCLTLLFNMLKTYLFYFCLSSAFAIARFLINDKSVDVFLLISITLRGHNNCYRSVWTGVSPPLSFFFLQTTDHLKILWPSKTIAELILALWDQYQHWFFKKIDNQITNIINIVETKICIEKRHSVRV